MASPTQWTWVWVNSGSWWWTGSPGVLQFMGSQRVKHDWVTELNWVDPVREYNLNKRMCGYLTRIILTSVQFSHSVLSNSLRPHGLQQARLPCPSLSPWVCPNSCPLSQWCHPTISSSVVPFSSCPQSFPASGSFPVSWHFTSGGPSFGASAPASVLPMNIQAGSPCSQRDSQESSPTPQFKSINSLALSLLYGLTSMHDY